MADPIQPDTLEDGDGDIGLDADVVTLEESQSVNEYEPAYEGELLPEPLGLPPGADPDEATALDENDGPILLNAEAGDLTTSRGAGANDDAGRLGEYFGFFNNSGTPSNSAVAGNTGKITPQPNVLDRFATYTYSASVYIMTPEQLAAYTRSGRRNVQGYNLLFQSGGAPNNIGGPQGGTGPSNAGRNPFFPLDYYIDSITINNSLFGKSTNAAHSVVDMKFTVVEPTNITLIDNIYKAAQDLAPRTAAGSINYAAAVYLMVIRFYGQDINGNIQQVGAADSSAGLSDASALVEKFIPFKIKEIKFSISNRLVTYEFDTAPIGQMVGAGTRRGTIPADIELSASTVGAMLTGDAQYSGATASAANPGASTTPGADTEADGRASSSVPGNENPSSPSKANNAPNNKKTIKQGLIAAMNEFQKELVKKKIYDVADEYVLEFANGAEAIRDGKIAKPDKKVNKSATPLSQAPSQNTQSASPDKSNVDVTARNWGVTAGMQMVQVIDLIIRNSSYITDQALVSIDEETGKPVPNPKTGAKGMKWYNIIMKTTQLDHDKRRNDYAYRITYTIVPYTLTDFSSPYFPIGNFRGVHKRYPYWFTGQNTQVLDYQASFNKLYNLTISGPDGTSNLSKVREKYTSSMRDIAFYQYQARSTESAQGAEGKANELAASAAEYLYNPSDNGTGKIRIVGDPAWLQQGSVTNTIQSKSVVFSPFLPDGTINFDVNDVMFEIAWQKPQDYDLSSGLADPYSKSGGDRTPTQSVVYRAKSVQSEFRQGRFEQTIEGTLYSYPVPSGTNKATTASNPVASTSNTGNDGYDGPLGSDTSDNSDSQREPLEDQTINTGNRPSGDQNNAGEELVQLGGPGFNDFAQSAEYENYGGPGLVAEPDFDIIDPGSESGEFDYRSPSPADDAAPAEVNVDPDSNGEVVGNAFGDAVPTSGRITVAQRAQINQNIRAQNIDGFDVEINPEPGNPQIIARDW
jgi:hypothetical protein